MSESSAQAWKSNSVELNRNVTGFMIVMHSRPRKSFASGAFHTNVKTRHESIAYRAPSCDLALQPAWPTTSQQASFASFAAVIKWSDLFWSIMRRNLTS